MGKVTGLKAWQTQGNKARQAMTLNNIGRVWSDLGDEHKALDYYNQAVPLSRAVGDKSGEATTLHNMGVVWSALGEKEKALDYYNQVVPLSRAVGDKSGEATALNNMSGIHFHNGELEHVIEMQDQILKTHREIGAVSMEAASLYNKAIVLQKMGRIEEAITCVEQGKAILLRHNLPQNAAGTTIQKYDVLLAQFKGEPAPQANVAFAENSEPAPQLIQEEAIAAMVQLYRQGGESALRQALQQADEAIDALVQQIKDIVGE
ncbi:MAG: tetratricopeptide repeat protein [Anaerolineae bacterium]|nr:tetratricopeptide repeat protein [Anaerolineae bacterium]